MGISIYDECAAEAKRLKAAAGPIRIHKVKIEVNYEGAPVTEQSLEVLARNLGDAFVGILLSRHKDADQIFTLGLHHGLGEGEGT